MLVGKPWQFFLFLQQQQLGCALDKIERGCRGVGGVKKAAGRCLSRDNSINRLRTSRPALVAELEHDSKESEQKARAQGIQKVITSFMFVASLYFFSDIMPQLTIFCKTLQAVDISLEGVLAAYQLTRSRNTARLQVRH